MLGLVLKSGHVFDGLREQTRRMSLQRYNEERRTRALEQYRDFFEASTDGMVVLDGEGAIVYVNRAAEQLTGYAREGLHGRSFTELVATAQRASLDNIVKQVVDGANLEVFDLALSTTSGETITVSVSSSPVLAEHGAAVLAFRDVTEARALEGELRKTKDFLERLIDSTVDGIIGADMRGNIIIFNQGAARLYGYAPDEVVGKLPVWKLYPDGVARAIMTELRSADYGGVGRMEPTRREIVTKDGELVPVSLAASIVYEDGREVATVGIIGDLRDRLKIEQRLAQAQEKLMVTEKQALIAELAGTTAHELNQPLTSVMGYAELLKRKMLARRRALPRASTSSCARPSAWRRSCARSARSRATRPRPTSARRRSSISTRARPMAERAKPPSRPRATPASRGPAAEVQDLGEDVGQRSRPRRRPGSRPRRAAAKTSAKKAARRPSADDREDQVEADLEDGGPAGSQAGGEGGGPGDVEVVAPGRAVAAGGHAGGLRAVAPPVARGARGGAGRHLRLDGGGAPARALPVPARRRSAHLRHDLA